MGMQTVGVIGAGQMGAGIAQVSAQAGYKVLLSDVSLERAEQGKAGIAKQLSRLVEKGKMEATDAEALLDRITPVGHFPGNFQKTCRLSHITLLSNGLYYYYKP